MMVSLQNIPSKLLERQLLDVETIDDKQSLMFTGWKCNELLNMLTYISTKIHQTANRNKLEALFQFWMYLKLDISFEHISIYFRISDKSIERSFYTILDALYQSRLIDEEIGFKDLNYDVALQRNTHFTETFFGGEENKTICILMDSTYCYKVNSDRF